MRAKFCVLLAAAVGVVCVAAMGAAATDVAAPKDESQYKQVVQRGIAYLTTKGQAEDGSYSAKVSPAANWTRDR